MYSVSILIAMIMLVPVLFILFQKAVPLDAPPISAFAYGKVLALTLLGPLFVIIVSYFVTFWAKGMIKQAMAPEVEAVTVEAVTTETLMRRPAPQATHFGQSRDEEIHARLVLHEHGLIHGGDLYSFGVELENPSAGRGIWVEFDAPDIHLKVIDGAGRIVLCPPTERSGPAVPIRTALIPPSGDTVFLTYDWEIGVAPGQKQFYAGSEVRHLKPGKFQVSGDVLVRVSYGHNELETLETRPIFPKDLPKGELNIAATTLNVSR
ncbi:MAG TPA: hypothetical protein PLY87_22320 [Planctomycetaceae bacterium]|nr:hypothetical protein [Planctomycetaceae bacterium]